MRVEAIKADSYVEIDTPAVAREYLRDLFKKNLEVMLKSAESEVNAQIAKLTQMHDVKILLEAPDVYIAAAAIHELRFLMGKGDRTAFFEIVLQTDPAKIPDLYRKLMLVTKSNFMGLDLYNDGSLCSPERITRKWIFRLWLHCVRKHNVLTLE